MDEDKPLYEEFNIPEDRWDELEKQMKHHEIDANDLVEYCKMAFPDDPIAQAKAAIIALDYHEWQESED